MWGDKPWISDSIAFAAADYDGEVLVTEVSVPEDVVYIAFRDSNKDLVARYVANEDGTATRIVG
jgi:hypothetical protein